MHNGQTISLKTILWKVLNNPLLSGLTYEDAAMYATEVIRLLGAPMSYEDKVTDPPLLVENYKAALPSDLISIRGARVISDLDNYEVGAKALRYATDIYHIKLDCSNDSDGQPIGEFTYTTQKGIIFTSIQDCHIQLSYKSLMVDEEGYPLIPDNEKLKFAIEYYIMHRFLEPLWMMGKITDKAFQYVEQKRHFYMGGADSSMKLAGVDHLESIMNTINRLIINTSAHNNFYKGTGEKERLRKFN